MMVVVVMMMMMTTPNEAEQIPDNHEPQNENTRSKKSNQAGSAGHSQIVEVDQKSCQRNRQECRSVGLGGQVEAMSDRRFRVIAIVLI